MDYIDYGTLIAIYLAIAACLVLQVDEDDPEFIESFGKLSEKQLARIRLRYFFWPITLVYMLILFILSGPLWLYNTIRKAI